MVARDVEVYRVGRMGGGERVNEEKDVGRKRRSRSRTWRCRTRRSRNRRR